MADDASQPDQSLIDTTAYGAGPDASISDPQERAAVTHHSVTVNGTTIPYTARAGHLTTVDPLSAKPNASLFYVSYTADGRPASGRPVTFFYNGGPGSSAVFLLLGSFAPRRIRTSLPGLHPRLPPTRSRTIPRRCSTRRTWSSSTPSAPAIPPPWRRR